MPKYPDWSSLDPKIQEPVATARAVNEAATFLGVTGLPTDAQINAAISEIINAARLLGWGAPVQTPVARIDITPPSATLAISGVPTQTPVASVSVSPTSATLNPPTQVNSTGAIRHIGFGHTYFGATPGTADMTWAEDAPLHRFMWCLNGPRATIRSLNPAAWTFTYCLHQFAEATGQEVSDGVGSAWGTLAEQWAQANGRNVENCFLHAALGAQNNVAVIATIDTTGKITLGRKASDNKQQLSQTRANAPESNNFQIGSTYTLTGVTGVPDGTTVTVTDIPSQTTIQTNLTGFTGTGGKIYKPGDGTLTKANRLYSEGETDWQWSTNPGSQDGKDFQVFRIGQIVGPNVTGCFFDSHTHANMPPTSSSVEYGGANGGTQYITDLTALFGLYRQAYPGSLFAPNLGNYTTSVEEGFAVAAGSCQQEGGINLFQPNDWGSGGTLAFTVSLLKQGVIVEVVGFPQFDSQEPQAGASGLSTAFRASGGHNYGSPDARAIITAYAMALLEVDQRTPAEINAGAPHLLNYDPANQFWAVFPLSARWYAIFEVNVGEPANGSFPELTLWESGTDAAGQAAHVYVRDFTADGTNVQADGTTLTPRTGLVMLRRFESGATVFDAGSAFSSTIPVNAPAGKTWSIINEAGTPVVTGLNGGDKIDLWMADSAILLAQ